MNKLGKLIIFTLVIGFLGCLLLGAVVMREVTSWASHNQAQEYFEKGNYEASLAAIEKTIGTSAYTPRMAYYRVVNLNFLNRDDEAETALGDLQKRVGEPGVSEALAELTNRLEYKKKEFTPVAPNGSANPVANNQNECETVLQSSASARGHYLMADEPSGSLRRWPSTKMPVAVYIDPSHPRSRELTPLVVQGFKQWTSVTHGRVTFRQAMKPEDADIMVGWTDTVAAMTTRHGMNINASGVTHSQGVGVSCMYKAKISVALADKQAGLFSRDELLQTLMHEIGHAMGLNHSSDPHDIMYLSGTPSTSELTQRDAASMMALYDISATGQSHVASQPSTTKPN